MATSFIHPDDENYLRFSRAIQRINGRSPNASYLTDSRQSVDKTMNKIQEMKGTMHPLALKFLNDEITYEPVAPGAIEVTKPRKIVLLELSERFFNYVDVMQYYIDLMKRRDSEWLRSYTAREDYDLGTFINFVTNICNLARRYKNYGLGKMLMTKDQILDELRMKDDSEIKECIDKAGHQSTFLIKLLEKIKEHVRIYDSEYGLHDTLLIVCRHLREQVVPMLQVLTDMNKSPEGHAFIQQLDLNKLILRLTAIDKLEKSLKGHELRVRIDAEARKSMIGDFGTKFVPKQAYSADEQDFVDSGNASQSKIGSVTISTKGAAAAAKAAAKAAAEAKVEAAHNAFLKSEKAGNAGLSVIGNKKNPVNGGRRTRHKRSGHKKRSNKKRSGKLSGKRSGKR